MSKLVEAAAEFLSRDTSTKQTRRDDLVEGLMSALAGSIIKGAANRQTPQQIANTTVASINKKAPGTKMHNHPNFSKFKQAVHSYVSAAKSGEEAFKRSSDDHVKGLAKKHFKEEYVNQLMELKKSTLASYVKKAAGSLADTNYKMGTPEFRNLKGKEMLQTARKTITRQDGIETAARKLAK